MNGKTKAGWACAVLAAAAGVFDSACERKAEQQAATDTLQVKEQFFPVLVHRTGPYAPNGVPYANGYVDYLELLNARDGGINGVRITFEECETGFATDRGVECYERLKGKGPTGATAFQPLSTGVTLAVTDKALTDHIPIVTPVTDAQTRSTAGYSAGISRSGARIGARPTC
jgi:Periplasmic binding protein